MEESMRRSSFENAHSQRDATCRLSFQKDARPPTRGGRTHLCIAERLKLRFVQNIEVKRTEYLRKAKRYATMRSDTISLELQTDGTVMNEFATKAFDAWSADVRAGARALWHSFVVFLVTLLLLLAGGIVVAREPNPVWLITSIGLAIAAAMSTGAASALIDTIRSCCTLRSYRSEAISEMCCTRNISVGQLGLYIAEPADGSRGIQISCHPFDKLAAPKLVEGREVLSVRITSEVGSTIPAVLFARNQRSQAEATLSILRSLIPDDRR
ncbi:hypothetical protein GOD96_18750 [Sinorhizobium medicae]|nr:hypothetical protein [Sinorhizobium medicae]